MKLGTALFAAALLASSAAYAEDGAPVRDAVVLASDGQPVGKVNRVVMAGDKVSAVQLIVGSRMVTLPAAEFTVDGGTVKATLTKREIQRR